MQVTSDVGKNNASIAIVTRSKTIPEAFLQHDTSKVQHVLGYGFSFNASIMLSLFSSKFLWMYFVMRIQVDVIVINAQKPFKSTSYPAETNTKT